MEFNKRIGIVDFGNWVDKILVMCKYDYNNLGTLNILTKGVIGKIVDGFI